MRKIGFNADWKVVSEQGDERVVRLPDDAMIREPRNAGNPSKGGGAYFPGGIYRYVKEFDVPMEWKNLCIYLLFEGVYKDSEVYINDRKVGGCAYGYSEFYMSVEHALRYGEKNRIEVIADNKDHPNSRWYTGSGIYRPVHLLLAEQSHIEMYGVKIKTHNYEPACIDVAINHRGGEEVEIEILDGEDVIATAKGECVQINLPSAQLWSDESPYLYTCRVSLYKEGRVVDTAEERFGIRLIEWSNQGLFVNGKETLLRGGCVHHSQGILGAAVHDKSEERRMKLHKKAGFNAIRSSHNPANVSMLRACDRLGLYVIDETWDMWYSPKTVHDYAHKFMEHYQEDIESLVRRDYNHPSVIMYSIANEVREPALEKGIDMTGKLVEAVRELDDTRPVTAGMNLMIISQTKKGSSLYNEEGGLKTDGQAEKFQLNSTTYNMITSIVGTYMNQFANSKAADRATSPSLDQLDIAGYNYASGRYKLEGSAHPKRIVMGSETFPQEITKNWPLVKKYPYVIGDFMWTSWDYLGEVGNGAWSYTEDGKKFAKPYPWLLSDTGVMDILGDENGELYMAQAVWGLLTQPMIAVRPVNHSGEKLNKSSWRGTNAIPSWSWNGCEGRMATVEVYTDLPKVALYVNEKLIGKKKVKFHRAIFKTPYHAGSVTAVSYDDSGKEIARHTLSSATENPKIQIHVEEEAVKAGEIFYVDLTVMGENQIRECNRDQEIRLEVKNGTLLGFGSANPRTEESYCSGTFTTYYGRAQAVIQTEKAGTIEIIAHTKELDTSISYITVK